MVCSPVIESTKSSSRNQETSKNNTNNAAKSQTDFDKAYNDQTSKWEYSVTKTTLTLGKKEDDQLSQWQYNKVFAYGDHFTSKDFYYQIAKGGQGEVKQKMTFKEIK